MRKLGFSILTLLLFTLSMFAQHSIVVKNNLDIDRNAEMVEVNTLNSKYSAINESVVLKNEKGEEVPYQFTYNDKKEIQGLIFQANVKAKSTAIYKMSTGKPAAVKAITYGRFVPERKDDFAWENDFAAYRMYGPALAKENPSNGVDFWAKKTNELIVDEFYMGELKQGLSYHRDRGHGMDFYKVGHTLGCGGIAPYFADSLWIGNHFNSYKVIENGPLRTIFMLTYDSVKVGSDFYKQTIKITSTAGSLLNKAIVTFTGKAKKIQLAAGIFLHDGKGELKKNDLKATMAYSEVATSEFKEPAGRNFVGVYVATKVKESKLKNAHSIFISDYKIGNNYCYYFGGGWNSWKFLSDEDWNNALNDFYKKSKSPLKVIFK